MYLILKAALSGLLIAVVSQLARRYPGFGALVASLPLVSILGALWLWKDRPDPANMAVHLEATFWYVLPSLPMFLVIPALLRAGLPFCRPARPPPIPAAPPVPVALQVGRLCLRGRGSGADAQGPDAVAAQQPRRARRQ